MDSLNNKSREDILELQVKYWKKKANEYAEKYHNEGTSRDRNAECHLEDMLRIQEFVNLHESKQEIQKYVNSCVRNLYDSEFFEDTDTE